MGAATILDEAEIRRAVTRIAHEVLERNHGAAGVVLAGTPRRRPRAPATPRSNG
jgi:pyrimidine operon attenuation protein/uracil phosphoribosyltransferase